MLEDAQVSVALAASDYAKTLKPLAASAGCALPSLPNDVESPSEQATNQLDVRLGSLRDSNGALILYTSGTTGRPKGELLDAH